MCNDSPLTVSVVIITRHRATSLPDALAALEAQRDKGFQDVVVVDNSDPERFECADVVRDFRWVTLVRTGRIWNNFHTYTRNVGTYNARSDIIAFLDDDSIVQDGWLKELRAAFSSPDIGAVGGIIDDPETKDLDPHRKARICRLLPNGNITDDCDCDPGCDLDVDHLRGCNWAVRRDVFVEAGRLDDCLWGYGYHEIDICTRIRHRGYRVVYHPAMRVYHALVPRVVDARGSVAYAKLWNLRRNLAYIYLKCFGWSIFYLRFLFTYQTGVVAILRRPGWTSLIRFTAGLHGKLSGILHYYRCRGFLKRTGTLVRGPYRPAWRGDGGPRAD